MSKPTIASPAHRINAWSWPALLCAALLAPAASAAPAAPTAPAASTGVIEVHVDGVTGAKGQVRVAVCDQERFLKQCLYTASAPARAGENVVSIAGVPAGAWAVLAYQDENDNSELDRNVFGIPKENYGFSRDAASRFGPPGFADAAITVQDAVTRIRIKLH